jgi:hypothetical protein
VDFSRYNPAIDTTFFPGTVSSLYWSSTTYAYYSGYAWYVYCSSGYVSYDGIKAYVYPVRAVRAVRGGQSRLFGHLFISTPQRADRWNIGEQRTITWDTAGISGNVNISLSRQGGKAGTFETIIESTENDGTYNWTVIGPISVNCVLKIEPLNDLSKVTSQGLFSISGGTVMINPDPDNISAPWTLTGPNSYSQSGVGDQTLTSLAPGDYTLTWGDVPG